jgi:hypothetical protein
MPASIDPRGDALPEIPRQAGAGARPMHPQADQVGRALHSEFAEEVGGTSRFARKRRVCGRSLCWTGCREAGEHSAFAAADAASVSSDLQAYSSGKNRLHAAGQQFARQPISSAGNLARRPAQLALCLRIGQQTFHSELQQGKRHGIVKQGSSTSRFSVRCWVQSIRTNSSVAIASLASTTARHA